MTGKERVLAALEHREADRVPRGENAFDSVFFKDVCGYDTLYNAGWEEKETLWAGGRDKVVADYVDAICAVAEKLDWDYVRVPVAPKKRDYTGFARVEEHKFKDSTGRLFAFNPTVGNVVQPAQHDADLTIEQLGDPDAPFIVDDSEMDVIRGVKERLGDTRFIIGRPPIGGTFSWDRIGMEEYLVRMITDPEFIHMSAHISCKAAIAYSDAFIKEGCDGIMMTEDYADTRGLIMGKARYEEFILPYLQKVCKAIHDRGAYFIKHTDGVMWDALDSFVEMGIDAWHGLQPSLGMNLKALKEKYGGKICFFGGVNVETLLVGSEEEIRAEVRHAVEHGAPGGGLVITCGNILEPGISTELYLSGLDETNKIGRYPIQI